MRVPRSGLMGAWVVIDTTIHPGLGTVKMRQSPISAAGFRCDAFRRMDVDHESCLAMEDQRW
jgi:hypothetical protein